MAVVQVDEKESPSGLREFIIRSFGIGVKRTLLREAGVRCPKTGKACEYGCVKIIVKDLIAGNSSSAVDCNKLKGDYDQ